MTPQDLLLEVFCLVDDQLRSLNLPRLRRRGPQPALDDSEVLAMALVGEFWKLDTDKDLFRFFRLYHRREFPALSRITRTTFTRQAANLWHVKQLVQRRLAERLAEGDSVWLVDRMQLPACPFARATFCRRFRGEADYGYDHLAKRTFYGFRLHLRTTRAGVILACELTPARASDASAVFDLAPPAGSTGVGDRADWSPKVREELAAQGVRLLAPYYQKSKGPDPARSGRLASVRYRIEAVNGQLTERYAIKRTWAKDLWRLCHRVLRKVLRHTVMAWLAVRERMAPLSFDRLQAA